MPRTIVSNYLSGLNLTNAADNPLGIGGGVTIANAAGSALVSNTSYYWTISNSGQISATGAGTTAGFGVVLAAGASLTNTTGAPLTASYTLTATSPQGCTATGAVIVTINPAAVATPGPAISFCSGTVST